MAKGLPLTEPCLEPCPTDICLEMTKAGMCLHEVATLRAERDRLKRYAAEAEAWRDRQVETNRKALELLGITYPGLCTDKVWGGGIVEGIEVLKEERDALVAERDQLRRELDALPAVIGAFVEQRLDDDRSNDQALYAIAFALYDGTWKDEPIR